MEVTALHSVAGHLAPGAGLITRPPFSAPHHTSSMATIVGGGSGIIRPGAASLAHNGVLGLIRAAEFHRDVLDSLRQPLESGEIRIARAGTYAAFPARFLLVLASEACPCGSAAPSGGGCGCSPAVRRRYLARLSGPLLDRIDVKIALGPAGAEGPPRDGTRPEASAVVAQRVATARERAAARLAGTPWRVSGEVPGTELRRSFPPEPDAARQLERAMELGQVSARGADKIARVAWTIADLRAKPRPGRAEIGEALSLWLGTPARPPAQEPTPSTDLPAVPGAESRPAGQAASRRATAPQPGTRTSRHR